MRFRFNSFVSSRLCFLNAINLLLFISGCGDGGSANGFVASDIPAGGFLGRNSPPAFSSSSYDFSITEETELLVGRIDITDADGDELSLRLIGSDAEALTINDSGDISFLELPDFESPGDEDEQNDYNVIVEASDGKDLASAEVIIFVENNLSDDGSSSRVIFELQVNVGSVTTPDYERPSTWDDTDGDCISDRHEVLIAQHLDQDGAYPLVMSPDGCKVETGRWLDPYDDIYYYAASNVQIDHVVALYESWISGLGNIDAALQRRYANTGSFDEGVLPETSHNFLAVGASSNGEKGSSDPTQWMPRNEAYHCTYLKKWVLTKSQNGLLLDQAEADFIEGRAAGCDAESLPELPSNP